MEDFFSVLTKDETILEHYSGWSIRKVLCGIVVMDAGGNLSGCPALVNSILAVDFLVGVFANEFS